LLEAIIDKAMSCILALCLVLFVGGDDWMSESQVMRFDLLCSHQAADRHSFGEMADPQESLSVFHNISLDR
jgi:hypothetical protein